MRVWPRESVRRTLEPHSLAEPDSYTKSGREPADARILSWCYTVSKSVGCEQVCDWKGVMVTLKPVGWMNFEFELTWVQVASTVSGAHYKEHETTVVTLFSDKLKRWLGTGGGTGGMCPPMFNKLLYNWLLTTLCVVSDCAPPPPIKKSFLRPCLRLSQEESHHIWCTHDWDGHSWLSSTFSCRQH